MTVYFNWELKKKNSIFILHLLKIIFVYFFVCFVCLFCFCFCFCFCFLFFFFVFCFLFLFFFFVFSLPLSLTVQASEDKTLNSLKLTLNSLKRLSQTLTSLSCRRRPDSILNVIGPLKLEVTDLPADPLRRTPKPTQAPSCRSMPQTHASNPCLRPISAFSDALNSLKLSPLCPTADPRLHSTSPTQLAFRWVVFVFFIYMLGIFDLGNWNDKFIIFVESNDKLLRIGMYWEFSVCRNLCFCF